MYGDQPTRDERRRRSIASSFARRDDFEDLLKMKREASSNPVAHANLEALLPETRMAFGSYQEARKIALAEGLIDAEGNPR